MLPGLRLIYVILVALVTECYIKIDTLRLYMGTAVSHSHYKQDKENRMNNKYLMNDAVDHLFCDDTILVSTIALDIETSEPPELSLVGSIQLNFVMKMDCMCSRVN